jgi:hypothetical protein
VCLIGVAVRIGWEPTFEQDPGLTVRQLVDIACKALSHAVNDPHTAVQATEHLAVSFAAMVSAPAGDRVATAGSTVAVVPERAFGDHLGPACGCAPLRHQVTGGRPGPPADAPRLRPARRGRVSRHGREEGELIVATTERAGMPPADLDTVCADAAVVQIVMVERGPRSWRPMP